MDLLELRDFCLSLPLTEETTPFDETTLVYKVAGKMFAMTDMEHTQYVTLKCEPERAIELREEYEEISGAYHMNKKHWNMVLLEGDLPAAFIREMIIHSYLMVVDGMSRMMKNKINKLMVEFGGSNI